MCIACFHPEVQFGSVNPDLACVSTAEVHPALFVAVGNMSPLRDPDHLAQFSFRSLFIAPPNGSSLSTVQLFKCILNNKKDEAEDTGTHMESQLLWFTLNSCFM